MRRPAGDLLRASIFAALAAVALPALAGEAVESAPTASAEASCRVSPDGAPAPAPRADLDREWARLAAEAPQARADGIRPLNTRGYNYDVGRGGIDPAAMDFEARGR
jgi:hypothetical protein